MVIKRAERLASTGTSGGRRRRIALLVSTLLVLATGALTAAIPASAATPMQVTITVHNVWELDCDDNEFISIGLFETCGYDYYAKAFFPSGEVIGPRAPDDRTDITPNWQLSGTFDRDAGPFGVRIQLWDHDSTSGDDAVDIADGDDNLDITVDPGSGDFSGDLRTPNIGWSTGSGDESAAIYFSVTFGPAVDFDADGIHDGLEKSAIGVGKDGSIPEHGLLRSFRANEEVPNPAGPLSAANPCRPTVLVEADWMRDTGATPHNHRITQNAIDESVATFGNAARAALSGCPYAGVNAARGVQLLIVVDDELPETLNVTFPYPSDPPLPPGATTGESIRDGMPATFDARIRPWYSWALFAHNQPGSGSSGLCCADRGTRPDILVTLGGFTAQVGDDREQSGTFMHELGHALGLGHGGLDQTNCKPNYLSIMNYLYQFTGVPDASAPPTRDINQDGVIDARDGTRMDYSRDVLLDLDEDALDESRAIGTGTDLFVWDGDGGPNWRVSPLNADVNWDNDSPPVTDPGTVSADVNFTRNSDCGSSPPPNSNPPMIEHFGFDDWAGLKFQAPLAAPGTTRGVPAAAEADRTEADAAKSAFRAALSTTDLAITLSDSPDPVAAGTALTYTVTVTNQGSAVPGYAVVARQTLPTEVTFSSAPTGCTHAAGVVTCALGQLAPGVTTTRAITVNVPAGLVYTRGGPLDITSSARVDHDGPDSDPTDDEARTTTRVVAVADLGVDSATATGPMELLLGTSGQVTLGVGVSNGGPSSPMDAVLGLSVTADAGVTVTPLTGTLPVDGLAVGSARSAAFVVSVRCDAPGAKTVQLGASISPKNAADTDPNAANDQRTGTLTVDCVVPIAVNVRPKGFPNSINLNTDATLAALTTRAGEYGLPLGFDSTKIDVSTALWGLRSNLLGTPSPIGAREMHRKGHPEDSYELNERTRDGDLDLVMHFKPTDSRMTSSSTEACLKGRYVAPSGARYTFFGCDSVRVVP